MDSGVLNWLVHVPAGDQNFLAAVARADVETIDAALAGPASLGTTKRRLLERRRIQLTSRPERRSHDGQLRGSPTNQQGDGLKIHTPHRPAFTCHAPPI